MNTVEILLSSKIDTLKVCQSGHWAFTYSENCNLMWNPRILNRRTSDHDGFLKFGVNDLSTDVMTLWDWETMTTLRRLSTDEFRERFGLL